MNKVYYFSVDEDNGGVFIAASTFKEAKKLSLSNENINDDINDYGYTKLHGHMIYGVKTKYYGELANEQLDELGIDYEPWEDFQ